MDAGIETMAQAREANANNNLVVSLKPWLWAWAQFKGVPPSVLEDVVAEAQAKALQTIGEVEGGQRPPPTRLEAYVKQLMRNAVVDWLRSSKPAPLSNSELTLINDFAWSITTDETDDTSDDGSKGWQAEWGPAERPQPRPGARPLIMILVRFMHRRFADAEAQNQYWREGGPFGKWKQARQLIDCISSQSRREIILLHLQGYRQKDIARRLLVTQQAVSKILLRQYAAWGWDDEHVQRLQFELAYVNVSRVIRHAAPSEREISALDEVIEFLEDLLEEGCREAKKVRSESRLAMISPRTLHKARIILGVVVRRRDGQLLWELPKRQPVERAPRIPLTARSRIPWDCEKSPDDILAEDKALYSALMNEAALAPWTDGLQLHHVPRLLAYFGHDAYDWDDYLAPGIWNDTSMQRIWEEACDDTELGSGH
jgi:DNA-directed RNA polymerase specialized sigma24 family protein